MALEGGIQGYENGWAAPSAEEMVFCKRRSELVRSSCPLQLREYRPDKNESDNGRIRAANATVTACIVGNGFILSQVYSGFCANCCPTPFIDSRKPIKVCVATGRSNSKLCCFVPRISITGKFSAAIDKSSAAYIDCLIHSLWNILAHYQ